MESYLTSGQVVLVTILVKLAVVASVASVLVRYRRFKSLLFADFRTWNQKGRLLLFLGVPILLSTSVRVVLGYAAADISMEMSLLGGLMGGRIVGVLLGTIGNLPGLLEGEWLAPAFGALAGFAGGLVHIFSGRGEEIWHFSPLFFLRAPESFARLVGARRVDRSLLIFVTAIALESIRIMLGRHVGHLFYLDAAGLAVLVLIFMSTLVAVGIPVKILNSTRTEMKLQEQEELLARARLDALISQIKPHFLFNTLNSVASLIRTNPEMARELILKLSHILRRLINSRQEFIPLKEELEFIDSYLDIEVARFGEDKLRVVKEIDPDSQEALVPAMILQPLVENAVGHGLAPLVDGGTLRISVGCAEGRLRIEIGDDGVGIPADRIEAVKREGVGVSNTIERLRVIYAQDHSFEISSELGRGTVCRITIPQVVETYA